MFKIFFVLSLLYLNILPAFSTTVMIWEPYGDNTYGHAAIQTKTYHMSLWPDGDVKEDYGRWSGITGVPGSLNFHHNYDRHLEGKRDPKIYNLESISYFNINEAYETVLEYNNITPDKVTLDEGEEILSNKNRPEIRLPKSIWCLEGNYYTNDNFYKYPQSCTTFSLALLSFHNDDVRRFMNNRVRKQQPMLGGFHAIEPPNPLVKGMLTVRGFNNIVEELEKNEHLKKDEENCVIS